MIAGRYNSNYQAGVSTREGERAAVCLIADKTDVEAELRLE
jgi:hypothetical protein